MRIFRRSALTFAAAAGFAAVGCGSTAGQGCGAAPGGTAPAARVDMKCGQGTVMRPVDGSNQCVPDAAAAPERITSTPESIAAHQAALGYNSDGTCPRGTSPNPYDPPNQRRCMTTAEANRQLSSRQRNGN